MANGQSDENGDGQQPEPNRLRQFYEGIEPVIDNLPEYDQFRDQLTSSRARRKTLYDDVAESGAIGDLPDNFQTFERKLFGVEEEPTPSSTDRQQSFEPGQGPLDDIMNFSPPNGDQSSPTEPDGDPPPGEEGFDARFNIRRNQKIRELRDEVDQLSMDYEAAKSEARENAEQVPAEPVPIDIPEPEANRRAQRIKEERDAAATRLSRVEQTILDEQDTGQSGAASAFNSFVQGTLSPLSEGVLKSASNTLTLMSPPGMREMRMQTQRQQPLYQAGEQVGNAIRETFPDNPKFQGDFWLKTLPTAAGFAASTIAGGGATRAAGMGARLGGSVIGSAALASNEFENALDRSGDAETAFQTFLYNLPVGATEGFLPGQFFAKLNKGTGGAAAKTLEQWVKTEGKSLAPKTAREQAQAVGGDFLQGGLEEFFQETTQNFLTNVGAQNIYDETRDLFDNVMEEGAAGFLIGSFLNGAGRAISQAREGAEGRQMEQIRQAEEFINEQQSSFARGDLATTAEQATGQGQPQTQIDFAFDPTAPTGQQVERLQSERSKLNDQASELDSDDPAQADYAAAIAQIDDLIQKKQSAAESTDQAVPDAEPSTPEADADQPTDVPRATQALMDEIDRADNSEAAAAERRWELIDAAEGMGIENPDQRPAADLLGEVRGRMEGPADPATPEGDAPQGQKVSSTDAETLDMMRESGIPEEDIQRASAPDILAGPEGDAPISGESLRVEVFRGSGREDQGQVYGEGAEGAILGEDATYFALDERTASQFGPEVESSEVTLQNPLVIDSDQALAEWMTGDPEGTIPTSNQERSDLRDDFRQRIEQAGYDGVVVNVPRVADVNEAGDSIKRLREVFGQSQVVQLPEAAAPQQSQTPYPEVSEDAQQMLEEIDTSGIQPDQMSPRLQEMAEQNGISITEDMSPADVISALRTQGASLESPALGRPVAEANLNMTSEPVWQGGLTTAARDNQTGQVWAGEQTHNALNDQFDQMDPSAADLGFLTEDGQFLTRSQAAQWRAAQAAGQAEGVTEGAGDMLFAEDLAEEGSGIPDSDQVQPGMLVQWNRQGQPQFDSPRRVREVETDAETGQRYVRVDGEPRWLPADQMEISDPEPTQSESELAAQIQYATEIADLSTELASNNYDEATAAAETATEMALDNGVGSYPEFYAMTAESIDGKPNPQALRTGWERALASEANSNKLAMNNDDGTLAARYREWTGNLSYQFMLQIYNENHPVSVMESRLAEQYNEADRFDYDNIDESVDTFIKLMPGRMSAVWDKYLNPRKRYSRMGQIVREAVARDIQMSDFSRMGTLYEQLAAANKAGDTARGNEIQAEIEQIAQNDELQQFLIAMHAREANPYAQDRFADEIEVLSDQISEMESRVENSRGQRREALQEELDNLRRRRDSRRQPLGMTVDQANTILNEFRRQEGVGEATKFDDLMAVAEKVWALNRQYLDEAVNIGVTTVDSRERMLDVYEYHIPAQRIITDEYGNVTGGMLPAMVDGTPKIYAREGSDRMIGHILTNITHNFDKMMRYGMKNQARIKTANIMREEMARGNTALGQVKAEHELSSTESEMAVPFREVQQREVPQEDGTTETERIIQEKYLVFSDPDMFDMYANINGSSVSNNAFMSIVKAVMNLQHFTIIGASLSFGPSNQFRDITDAMQNALSELDVEIARIPKEILMGQSGTEINNWKDFLKQRVMPYHRGIVHFERTGDTDSQASSDYQRLKELGGTTTFYRVLSQEKMMSSLEQAGQEVQALAEKKPSLTTAKAAIRKVGNGIDYWNNMWENSLRTVLFRIGLDSGMSETKAAEFALETMPNFNRIGKLGRRINNHFLFFNASIAAMASHGFAWKGGTAKVLTSTAAIAMASYFNGMFNDMFSDDDEYEKDKRVNTWKYHKNVVMNQFDEDGNIQQFSIPVGYSSSVYWGIGGDLYDLQQGYIDEDEFNKRLATNLVDVYNPMSGADMFEDTNHAIYAMTPTHVKPIGSLATNVIFGGRLFSEFKTAQPTTEDWQLYSPYTPKTFRYASEWLNKNDIADMSPKTLNLWWEWATNSAGKDVGGFKEFYDAFVEDEEFNADQLPVLRRFYRDMSQAEVNYRSIWDRITRYTEDAPPAGTDEMEEVLDRITQEYARVEDSDTMPEYQIESLDNGIQTYVDFLHKRRRIQDAKEYFSSRGWNGSSTEDPHKEKRYQYYKRENYKAKNFEFANLRYRWENGRFIRDQTSRLAYTMDIVRQLEGQFKTPGEDITFTTK